MMMKRMLLALLACMPGTGLAAMYKCVDAQGHVTYSQVREAGKRCVEAVLPPVQVIPAPPVPQSRSSATGEAGPAAQASSSEQELADAKKALEEARRKLAEQEAIRYGDERNYQKVLDRLKPYQDAVAAAEARLKQLQDAASQSITAPTPGRDGTH